VIGVFIFTRFLNKVNVVPPSMPHLLSFLACLLSIKCAARMWMAKQAETGSANTNFKRI
jgi:hypothetical protein